jgi:F-type H+-transporting ATPase subunit b
VITLDYTVVIQIASFLLFWFLLNKILFRPFLELLAERERRTEGFKAQAASLAEEVERLRAAYESGIAKAREEGDRAKAAILADGRLAREHLLAQARDEAGKILQQARDEIQGELQRGKAFAAREAEGIARQMAEKILGRRVG